jgi:pyruvate-formate lyase-activating enzyme
MTAFRDPLTLHLEMTTRCNASCPLCARTIHGGRANPNLKPAELKLHDIKTALPPQFLEKLQFIYLCGNFGDPAVAQDTLEVLKYFRTSQLQSQPQLRLMMMTNGSVRTPMWWRELAGVLDECEFGVDGLADTNALYRRGTNFEKIMENARAYIDAGGSASWQFIVFQHNEHQIEEARALAREIGFKNFSVKKTSRFFSSLTGKVSDRAPVMNAVGEVEYELAMPTQQELRNPSLQEITKQNFDQCAIECKALKNQEIYMSAEGHLWPCCWLAGTRSSWEVKPEHNQVLQMLAETPGGIESLNALKHPAEKILSSAFFVNNLPESWQKPSLQEGKLRVCAKTCGSQVDLFQAQFSPS